MPVTDLNSTAVYPTGIGRRMGALLYDLLLVIAIWMATLFPWVIFNDGKVVSGPMLQMVLLAELAGFYLFFWSRQGQTLGMTAWRIRLVDMQGRAPSFGQLLLRAAAAPLSFVSCGLGYLWLYVGDERQTWHDRLSRTMVVHIPKKISA